MFHSLIIFLLFPILCLGQNIQQFRDCSTKFYTCGQVITSIGFPFWGNDRPAYCGLPGFQLTCREGNATTLQITNTTYHAIEIDQNNSRIVLAVDDLWRDQPNACSLTPNSSINITTFEYTSFTYVPGKSLFLELYFSCTQDVVGSSPFRNRFSCLGGGGRVNFFENRTIDVMDLCKRVIGMPVLRTVFDELRRNKTIPMEELLRQGFELGYKGADDGICLQCEISGGTCGSNSDLSTPSCICSNGYSSLLCSSGSGTNWKIKLFLGLVTGIFSLSIVLIFKICFRMKFSLRNGVALFKHRTEDDKTVEAFVKEYGSLSTKRYTYTDIKKMTNSFGDKLGQGGFGTVFKGKLSDGRLVAVKILNSSKASGQEFINEVASIGRTSHINIVILLGFCFDYQKRALVYEFMPSGSLDKFIYGHVKTSEHIEVEKLFKIAIGIAQGLDYLHRGCNTRILHLDIKPHNILLDEDFSPKIADFGLAKLYSRKESIVSMLEARGTIGYIAPEVFNRQFGGVSHKSDVYSYGMLILEMVGGRKNVDAGVGSGHTSEIYFPYWIYNRLNKKELLLDGAITVEENDYARKMTIVGLWCIQTDPKQRPSINEVIDMLEGGMETLEIPPKPFLSSPPRSQATTFNISQEEECSLKDA